MKSLIIGALGMAAVILASVEGEMGNYIQYHAMVLVLGGTIMLFFFVTPGPVFKTLGKTFKMLTSPEEAFTDYSSELSQLAKTKRLPAPSKNRLIRYAQELWEQGIDTHLFVSLLSQRRIELENETIDAVQTLKNLSKYPPALGMTGTVMGMIALFSELDGNQQKIGANIALAMTATFFGLIVANGAISPLSDRLQVRHVNRKRMISNIYQILLLINQGEASKLISDEVDQRVA